jgi:NADPH:quinone reductase-like Zn-dependent oxidoreductase
MRAIVRTEYGSPDVLRLADVPRPTPADDEVLIRVHAAAVNKGDTEILQGKPLWVRLVGFGLVKPKVRILGCNLAGRIEAVGSKVTELRPGDEVFGDIMEHGLGAFAEYVSVPQDAALVRKPPWLTFEEAASLPESGFIAIQALRDEGHLNPGSRVLVNGAGGGAGSFAVQLAKSLEAEVTAVDKAEKLEWMHALGADHVIDHAREDLSRLGQEYDLILDVVGVGSLSVWKRALTSRGIYLAAGGSVLQIVRTLLYGAWVTRTSDKRMGVLAVKPNRQHLVDILALVETGKVKATIDRVYPLREAAAAVRYVAEGRSKGKVVITI